MDEARAARMAAELRGKSANGWIIGELLGNGKSALVFKTTKGVDLGAIKIFDPELIERYGKDAQEERIRRELSLIGKHHPNLVRILDGGMAIINESNYWFIVMEYLPWKTLKDVIPTLPLEAVRSLLKKIAEAAKYLESLDLCHRDIKPANIAVSDCSQEAKLLDFGVLRPFSLESGDPTGPAFVGTTRYASPEFLLRQEKDDIIGWRAVTFYQLGGVLHDMLTRRPLFEDFSDPPVNLSNAVQQRVPNGFPSEPADLVHLAKACLAKDPHTRLQAVSWEDFLFENGADPIADLKRAIAKIKHGKIGESMQVNSACLDERWQVAQIERIIESVRHELQSDQDTFPRGEALPHRITRSIRDFSIAFSPSITHGLSFYASFLFRIEFPSQLEPIVKCYIAGAIATDPIEQIAVEAMDLWYCGEFESTIARKNLRPVLLNLWIQILQQDTVTSTPTLFKGKGE